MNVRDARGCSGCGVLSAQLSLEARGGIPLPPPGLPCPVALAARQSEGYAEAWLQVTDLLERLLATQRRHWA